MYRNTTFLGCNGVGATQVFAFGPATVDTWVGTHSGDSVWAGWPSHRNPLAAAFWLHSVSFIRDRLIANLLSDETSLSRALRVFSLEYTCPPLPLHRFFGALQVYDRHMYVLRFVLLLYLWVIFALKLPSQICKDASWWLMTSPEVRQRHFAKYLLTLSCHSCFSILKLICISIVRYPLPKIPWIKFAALAVFLYPTWKSYTQEQVYHGPDTMIIFKHH